MKGFTLIELLVVMLILGLGAGLMSFNLEGVGDSQNIRQEVIGFVTRSRTVAQEAIATDRTWGAKFYQDRQPDDISFGYRWLEFRDDAWVPAIPSQMKQSYSLDPNITLELETEGVQRIIDVQATSPQTIDKDEDRPDILFLNSGEMTPFRLKFIDQNQVIRAVVEGDLLGRITDDKDVE